MLKETWNTDSQRGVLEFSGLKSIFSIMILTWKVINKPIVFTLETLKVRLTRVTQWYKQQGKLDVRLTGTLCNSCMFSVG